MEASSTSKSLPASFVVGFHDRESVSKMKYCQLGNTGLEVSVLGLGGASFGCVYGEVAENTRINTLLKAITSGINYIDTAPWYGQGRSEELLGKALENIPRQAFYIATKVGRYERDVVKMFDFTAERVMQSVDKSLKLLKLDYVDIIQIHDVEFAPSLDIILNETLPALEKIVQAGKARFIGITGYPVDILRQVVERSEVKIDTVLSYSRCCLHDSTLLDFVPCFNERGIGVINASATSMGLLTERGPPDWHSASPKLMETCRQAVSHCKQEGVDVSKLATWFSLNQTGIQMLVVGADSEEILSSNIATATQEKLDDKEQCVLDFILETFFKDIPEQHWEGVQLTKYWAEMDKAKLEVSGK